MQSERQRPAVRVIERDSRRFFLMELRNARQAAQKDSESFDEILFVLERLGSYLLDGGGDLGKYQRCICELAGESPLGMELATSQSPWHSKVGNLYELVRVARNEALHQGARARHLTEHLIELGIVIEDACANGSIPLTGIEDIMVRTPVVAEEWQPVSFVRKLMLTNAFSFIPILANQEWKLISDYHLAAFLRGEGRRRRMAMTISEATTLDENALKLENARVVDLNESLAQALQLPSDKPILVSLQFKEGGSRLVGILSAFDVL